MGTLSRDPSNINLSCKKGKSISIFEGFLTMYNQTLNCQMDHSTWSSLCSIAYRTSLEGRQAQWSNLMTDWTTERLLIYKYLSKPVRLGIKDRKEF